METLKKNLGERTGKVAEVVNRMMGVTTTSAAAATRSTAQEEDNLAVAVKAFDMPGTTRDGVDVVMCYIAAVMDVAVSAGMVALEAFAETGEQAELWAEQKEEELVSGLNQ